MLFSLKSYTNNSNNNIGISITALFFFYLILLDNPPVIIGVTSASMAFVVIVLIVVLLVLCITYGWQKRNVKKSQDEIELAVLNSQQITFGSMIRTGQFGTVYHARSKDQDVSIAVYRINSDGYKLWNRERYIYLLPSIEHENILKFIDSDDKNPTTLRIICEDVYHGSLRQYLQWNTLTSKQLGRLADTAVKGLCHLHTSKEDRAAIAHRDINSDSILVKSDLTSVISNFSVAVECDKIETSSVDIQV